VDEPNVLVISLLQTSLPPLCGRSAKGSFLDLLCGDGVGLWLFNLLQIQLALLGGCRGIGQGLDRLGIPVVVAVEIVLLMVDNSFPVV
jgi:hypothetical protein